VNLGYNDVPMTALVVAKNRGELRDLLSQAEVRVIVPRSEPTPPSSFKLEIRAVSEEIFE